VAKKKLNAGLRAWMEARKAQKSKRTKTKTAVKKCYAKEVAAFKKKHKRTPENADGYNDRIDDIKDTCLAKHSIGGYL